MSALFLTINDGPPILFTSSCVRLECQFKARPSDAVLARYEWDFGDGSTASGVLVKRAFSQPGTYRVRLTVLGGAGGPKTGEQIVQVQN